MLPPRHMFLAPVLFSSGLLYPSVVRDGTWWPCSSCGSGYLMPGFQELWVRGPTELGRQAHRVGERLQSPREVLQLQIHPQKTFIRSHSFRPQLHAVDPFTSSLHKVSHVSTEEILERSGGKSKSRSSKTEDCSSWCYNFSLELFNKL